MTMPLFEAYIADPAGIDFRLDESKLDTAYLSNLRETGTIYLDYRGPLNEGTLGERATWAQWINIADRARSITICRAINRDGVSLRPEPGTAQIELVNDYKNLRLSAGTPIRVTLGGRRVFTGVVSTSRVDYRKEYNRDRNEFTYTRIVEAVDLVDAIKQQTKYRQLPKYFDSHQTLNPGIIGDRIAAALDGYPWRFAAERNGLENNTSEPLTGAYPLSEFIELLAVGIDAGWFVDAAGVVTIKPWTPTPPVSLELSLIDPESPVIAAAIGTPDDEIITGFDVEAVGNRSSYIPTLGADDTTASVSWDDITVSQTFGKRLARFRSAAAPVAITLGPGTVIDTEETLSAATGVLVDDLGVWRQHWLSRWNPSPLTVRTITVADTPHADLLDTISTEDLNATYRGRVHRIDITTTVDPEHISTTTTTYTLSRF